MNVTNVQRILQTLAAMLRVRSVVLNTPLTDAATLDALDFVRKYASADNSATNELFVNKETERVLQDVVWNLYATSGGVSIVFVDSEKLRSMLPHCVHQEIWVLTDDEGKVSRDLKHIPVGSRYLLMFPDDLRHNILGHHEMPSVCRVLTKKEIKELCAKYAIKKTQLPVLRLSDPVSRLIDARKGDVVYTETKGGPQGVLYDVRQVFEDVEYIN